MPTSPVFLGSYPQTRLRRNRQKPWSRDLVAENHLSPRDLIWPIIVCEGNQRVETIDSMPGVERISVDLLPSRANQAYSLGIRAIAIFPKVLEELKSPEGVECLNPDNLVCRAVREIKKHIPEIGVICDVALDPYTSHGQDGIVQDNNVINDRTVEVLCRQALNQANSGCDVLAPSDMMDGRVRKIRIALDKADFQNLQIMSYAAKFASSYYGPFREAIGSAANLANGDKRTYQVDPRNSQEALRESAFDIDEGADMLIVKPGLPYLDVIKGVKETFSMPTYAYQVSGEYSMIMAASERGWISYSDSLMETLICFKRAGADGIITYGAVEAAKLLNDLL